MIIYCIENLINGKRYVGQYSKCNSNEEFQKSRCWGHGKLIIKAIKKYGKNNFKKWAILHCDNNKKDFYEILWIKKLDSKVPNGYNLSDGGEGTKDLSGMINKKRSLSLKNFYKLNIHHLKGKKLSIEHRNNIKMSLIDHKCSKKTKQLIKESNFGQIRSEITCKNISEGVKKVWAKRKSLNTKLKYNLICEFCKQNFVGTSGNQKKCLNCMQITGRVNK